MALSRPATFLSSLLPLEVQECVKENRLRVLHRFSPFCTAMEITTRQQPLISKIIEQVGAEEGRECTVLH